MDKIEIALATYNGARFLPEFLDSLARQTYLPGLIRVRDDGSVDNTIALLEERIALGMPIVFQKNNGERLGAMANFGRILENNEADYVLLADQDDLWHPQKIEIMMRALKAIEAQVGQHIPTLVYSDARLVLQNGDVLAESAALYQGFRLSCGLHFHRVLVQNIVPGCTMMVNKALIEAALPIPTEAVMHDWWLLLVASGLGRVGMVNQPLVDYRQHENNTVGAQSWGILNILSKARYGPARAKAKLRARFEGAVQQAHCLHDRFVTHLSDTHRAELDAMLSLNRLGPIARRARAVRYGLRKEGILRTLAFYYAL